MAESLREVHYVCPEGFRVTENTDGTFSTGMWVANPEVIKQAVNKGLKLGLHQSRATDSYLQGIVKDIVRVETQTLENGKTQRRVRLLVEKTSKPLPWAGGGSGERGYVWA